MAWEQGRAWSKGSTRQWRTRRAQILERDDWICRIQGPHCTGYATEVDHVVDVVAGGSDEPENLRGVCPNCHAERTRRQAAAGRARRRRSAANPVARHPGLL